MRFSAHKRFRIDVTGLVQGVGFRPFLQRLASDHHLGGWARNAGGAVISEIEGSPDSCSAFLRDLQEQAPTPSQLETINVREISPGREQTDFTIQSSDTASTAPRFIPVDIGICPACRSELLDSSDRRHEYPFINCCQCGPRYSIVRDLPYDRERTSMRSFHLCPDCECEYEHEKDRRFHAEPNACPECGPQYTWLDPAGQIIGGGAFGAAVDALENGRIVAIKGVGGFHLACRADDEQAIARLRAGKHRIAKPLAVMVADLDEARRIGSIGPEEADLLTGADRPIVLVRAVSPAALPANINPGLATVGVMLPNAPIHILLLQELGHPIVYTSANRTGETLISDNEEAIDVLAGVSDGWMLHDRTILNRADDSIARVAAGRSITIRAGRGKAPTAIRLPGRHAPILACGGDLKASFCLADRGWAHLSPYLGDLLDASCFERYRETIGTMERLLGIEPRLIACDGHPDYISTTYADSLGYPVETVQHHHAHIASAMAEHGLSGPVIGVAFDGLGWGSAGHVWGGEWLVADLVGFKRAAHLKEVRLPGGDAAARHPWRTAVSYLHLIGAGEDDIRDLLPGVNREELKQVSAQIRAGINTPWTSSCGRLFEAVAALTCGILDQNYEGQAASQLEAAAGRRVVDHSYRFRINAGPEGCLEVDAAPMLAALVADIGAGTPIDLISARFHDALAHAVTEVAIELRDREGLNEVVLAGGVFVNARLLETTVAGLENAGFRVCTPMRIPINDGGLSLGQAAVAAAREAIA